MRNIIVVIVDVKQRINRTVYTCIIPRPRNSFEIVIVNRANASGDMGRETKPLSSPAHGTWIKWGKLGGGGCVCVHILPCVACARALVRHAS